MLQMDGIVAATYYAMMDFRMFKANVESFPKLEMVGIAGAIFFAMMVTRTFREPVEKLKTQEVKAATPMLIKVIQAVLRMGLAMGISAQPLGAQKPSMLKGISEKMVLMFEDTIEVEGRL